MTAHTVVERDDRARPTEPSRPRSAPRAGPALQAGLVLTVLAMAGLTLDLAATGVLAEHLRQVYEGHYVTSPGEGVVAGYLYSLGGLGTVGWLWTIRSVRRHDRLARPVATILFLGALLVAVAHLTVTEYGQTILPIEFGLVGLLPTFAGLVAVVQLWTGREPLR